MDGSLRRSPRPLFLVGNKRSGTSLLVKLLNCHPNVFVTHESDIVWLLYCLHNDIPFRSHPQDGFLGAKFTLGQARDLLDKTEPPYETYVKVQTRLMERGNAVLKPTTKEDLKWLGDKKPVQQLDPDVLAFTKRHFPDARYLHIFRHPVDWLESIQHFIRGTGYTAEEAFTFWLNNERRALEAKRDIEVYSFGYDALCREPEKTLERIFAFLDLDLPASLMAEAERIEYRTYSDQRNVELPKDVEQFWDSLARS